MSLALLHRPAAGPSTLWTSSELVTALRDGHPHAAAVVWDRHMPLVRRVLRRTLGPRSDLSDGVQNSFVLLFEKIDKRNGATRGEPVRGGSGGDGSW